MTARPAGRRRLRFVLLCVRVAIGSAAAVLLVLIAVELLGGRGESVRPLPPISTPTGPPP